MTTEPTQEYVNRQLQLADEALNDALLLLQHDRLKAASNRAYYAIYHSVQTALANVISDLPRSHSGSINQFGRHYVRTGIIDKRFARYLQDAYNIRRQSDYEVFYAAQDSVVGDTVRNAQDFVEEITHLLKGDDSAN